MDELLNDLEAFEIELERMLEDARIFGLPDCERDSLRDSLLTDFEQDPADAWEKLNFWKIEYAEYLDEMEVAA